MIETTELTTTYIVTGKTYQYQDTIRRLGGIWDAASKSWAVNQAAADYLSSASNFGRRAMREGTGLVIRPRRDPGRESNG